MSIYEADGGYRVRYEFEAHVKTIDEADGLWRRMQAHGHDERTRLARGESVCPGIATLSDVFLDDRSLFSGIQHKTRTRYEAILRRFARDFGGAMGDIAVDLVRREMVYAWRSARLSEEGRGGRVSPRTVNREVGLLKRFARWCAERRYCAGDVDFLGVPPLREPGRDTSSGRMDRSVWPIDDLFCVLNILQRHRPDLARVLDMMALCGVREEAVFRLRMADVEMPRDEAGVPGVIRFQALKGGLSGEVPFESGSSVDAVLREAIAFASKRFSASGARRSKSKPLFVARRGAVAWTTERFCKALNRTMSRLRITGFTAYEVRHAMATYLTRVGAPALQQYLKHRRMSTQEWYRHQSGAAAIPAYEAVEALYAKKRSSRV